ncbi:cyclic nucleotide-binding domain-containing protein [Streptomyces sp. NPDC002577]
MTRTGALSALPRGYHDRLMAIAREVSFDSGERIFKEGDKADRFWIIQTGTVDLDLHVPGRRAAVIESLHAGELLGWSSLIPPHHRHLGAEASSPVRAYEFDATVVRELCEQDPVFGRALMTHVSGLIANRLRAARLRLLNLYAPYGAGPVP